MLIAVENYSRNRRSLQLLGQPNEAHLSKRTGASKSTGSGIEGIDMARSYIVEGEGQEGEEVGLASSF